MEITKIIMPKTDPDVLRELASKRIQEIRKTPAYQEASNYRDNIQKINDCLYGSCGTTITYLLFPLCIISIYFLAMETLISNIAATVLVAFVIFWVIFLFYGLYKQHVYEKLIENYEETIDDQLQEYMISDVFEDSKYNFVNCGYIIDIDHLKEFIKDENASYIITHPIVAHDWQIQNYCKNDIILCKVNNGIVTDKLELDDLYGLNIKDIITENNELNLSYIDKNFWVDTTPYWEQSDVT